MHGLYVKARRNLGLDPLPHIGHLDDNGYRCPCFVCWEVRDMMGRCPLRMSSKAQQYCAAVDAMLDVVDEPFETFQRAYWRASNRHMEMLGRQPFFPES
jgi:hypothetical protein